MRSLRWILGAAIATIVASAGAVLWSVRPAAAADHRDSPLSLTNPRLDINDVYVFRSPVDADNVVLALTVHPALTPASGRIFEPGAVYELNVSRDGDFVADTVIQVQFDDLVPQGFRVSGIPDVDLAGTVAEFGQAATVAADNGVQAFAGARDDPFFFDLDAFNAFIAGPYLPTAGLRGAGLPGPPQNFFGTLNVGAIVLEIPAFRLTGDLNPNVGTLRVWAKTYAED